ncbi:cutinase family protein [Mycobacterium xenopi 3993]|nr:cutinase family protein [Mycobacterium xenopi 3993]
MLGLLTAAALAIPPFALIPPAHAASCPDVQVVFARGRLEPAGTGQIGTALVSALRSRVSGKNIGVYPVNYAANADVVRGANDMSGHIQYMANTCPDTRLVLGGYSLGAAVTDVVLAAPGPMLGFTNPLPPGADEHIAAVALFGNGTQWVGRSPPSTRSTTTGPLSCVTAPTRSATRPTRKPGRITGLSIWLRPTSKPEWLIRQRISSPENSSHAGADRGAGPPRACARR